MDTFAFAVPRFLFGLLALIPLLCLIWLREQKRRSVIAAIGLSVARNNVIVRGAFAGVALAALAVALAQPQVVAYRHKVVRESVQIAFLIDTSLSMAASAAPRSSTRLDRAKNTVRFLVENLDTVQFAIYSFSSAALPQFPFSTNTDHFQKTLKEAVTAGSPTVASGSRTPPFSVKTDIPYAVWNVLGEFDEKAQKKILVVISDGQSDSAEPALDSIKSIIGPTEIFAMVVGKENESLWQDAAGIVAGEYVPLPVVPGVLQEIAALGQGKTFFEGETQEMHAEIEKSIAAADRTGIVTVREYADLSAPLYLLALTSMFFYAKTYYLM